jgi:HEAT repeat protein
MKTAQDYLMTTGRKRTLCAQSGHTRAEVSAVTFAGASSRRTLFWEKVSKSFGEALMPRARCVAVVGIAAALWVAAVGALASDSARLRDAARAGDWKAVEAMGPSVLPELARIYRASSVAERAQIAQVFYNLGWKSEDAKRALMADVHTSDQSLRLQVQWALGRVSDDPAVVDVLLENMRNDPVPLFRDKAACALAYDQVHLAPAQKLRLFEGLIGALDDPKLQVRQVAIQALAILTHQTKGYAPGGDVGTRSAAVGAWLRWLDEYRANL